MNSISSRLKQKFLNLRPDAVPRAPDHAKDKDDIYSKYESHLTEEDMPPKSSHNNKNDTIKPPINNIPKSNKKSSKDNNSKPPSSPINTQATGNVINIVNSNNIHWGPEITYIMGEKTEKKENTEGCEEIKKTKSIASVMSADIKAEHEYLDYISKNLGKSWRSFFRKVGYSQGYIETVEETEAQIGISEARYKLLLEWVRNDNSGTLGRLATLLWQAGEKPVVKGLAILYKNNACA